MMHRAWYVVCDVCGDPADVSVWSAKDARDIAHGDGFVRVHDSSTGRHLDLCPEHANLNMGVAREAAGVAAARTTTT